MKISIASLRQFVGPKVANLFFLSALAGIVWFLSETAFVYILQSFLVTIGLISGAGGVLAKIPWLVEHALLALVVFGFLRAFAAFLRNYLITITQFRFVTEQRERLLAYGLRNAHRTSMKELIANFGDTTSNAGLVIQVACILIYSIFSGIAFFAFGLWLAPVEMITGLVLLAVLLLPFARMGKTIGRAGTGISTEWREASDALIVGLKNHFLLHLYRQTDREIDRAQLRLERYFKHFSVFNASATTLTVYPVFAGIVVVAVLTWIAKHKTGTDPLTLVSFFYVFIRLSQAASEVNSNYSMIRFHLPSFLRLFAFASETPAPVEVRSGQRTTKVSVIQKIEVKNVSFAFGDRTLFRDLNFQLMPGQSIAIIGESGAGKSTLLSLLLGLLPAKEGSVKLNGVDIGDVDTNFYDSVGYVGPEPFLVEGTIRQNLLFGYQGPSKADADLWSALEMSALDQQIRELPGGLDHALQESTRLSTGQKQRLSIARAMLRRPSLLVFDEGTGNLDVATEEKIIRRIRENFPESIQIFVTHRRELAQKATFTVELGGEG